jgi:hypothetical protein
MENQSFEYSKFLPIISQSIIIIYFLRAMELGEGKVLKHDVQEKMEERRSSREIFMMPIRVKN